jgi:lipopolysaccharide export system protein LptC
LASYAAHTTRVLFLRWILPVFAVITLIGVIAWPAFKEFELTKLSANSKTALKVKDISLSLPKNNQPMELTVNKPEYSGLDEQNHPYLITADRVIQKGMQQGAPMTLQKPIATVTMNTQTQENIQIDGSVGVYDPTKKTLQLAGPVTVTHSAGYVMNLQELFADVTKGYMVSTHPVTGNGPGGTLQGESMEIRNRGDDIILHGQSKVTLIPKEK